MTEERPFEKVYTMTDYHDGPRRGIANFGGRPHLYESEWSTDEDEFGPLYSLAPVSEELLVLALEDWAIWRRWETALHEGRAAPKSHPALPADRERHEQLQAMLESRLVMNTPAHQARAEFRGVADPDWNGLGWAPMEVRWMPVNALQRE